MFAQLIKATSCYLFTAMGLYDKNTQNAPSTSVVVPFFILSAASWLLVTVLLFFQSNNLVKGVFFSAGLLSITHLFVLGFVSSVMFGALFQLLPVIFIQKIHSEKLAKYTFAFLLAGMLGLVLSFANQINGWGLTISGVLVNIAVILFMLNIWQTIGRSTENNTAKIYIRTSAVWLVITTLAGLSIAVNFWFPYFSFNHLEFLKIHAHLGVIGWFISLIIGVSCVLVPMFLLVHHLDYRPLNIGYFFINGGLIAGVLAKITSNELLIYVAYISVAIGLILYLKFIYNVYRARPRKSLDLGLQKTMFSFLFLILGMLLAISFIVGYRTKETIFYLAIILIGFVATIILGQFYKTLPFIIWLKVYKPFVGKTKTLLPKQLYDHSILKYQYFAHISGFSLFVISLLFHLTFVYYLSIFLMMIGAVLFLTNVLKVVYHKRKIIEETATHYPEVNSSSAISEENTAPTETDSENPKLQPSFLQEVTEDDIYYKLMEVIDPELFVNIIDLGLVYELDFKPDPLYVKITMTLTSKGCPLSDAIKADINGTLNKYFPGIKIFVNIIWEPAWDMDKVSDEGRRQLMSRTH